MAAKDAVHFVGLPEGRIPRTRRPSIWPPRPSPTRLTKRCWRPVRVRASGNVPERLGVDETSSQKRHEYVTVVNDLKGRMLHVSDGHGKEALREFYEQFEREELEAVKTVAMGMWEP